MFFRGYVETKNKECIEKIKGRRNFKTIKDVQGLSEYAGILAQDIILIDIDDEDQSECLFQMVQDLKLECRVYKTTRGKHFLFFNKGVNNNRTKASLAIGLKADIKLGKKNSYSILKFNRKEREIIHDTECPSELPKWLLPIRASADFFNMEAGDGRNQALFNYILALQSADFSKEEAKQCINLINRYIIKEPLPESELETILRDEAFLKPTFLKGDRFLFDKFAIYLKNNNYIKKINNQLHIYDNGVYMPGKLRIEYEMIKNIPELNKTKRQEVYDYLNVVVNEETESMKSNLIPFRNGIYDLIKDELIPFSPEHIITNRIEWDYNPNACYDLVDEVFNKISCYNPKIRKLLEEIIGYCFYRRNELGKAFILIGEKENGKSTYLDMIKNILGEKNISALDLSELNERFKTAEIFGKLANIGDDIESEFIPNTGIFKKLVTGENLTAERKGQDPFIFHSYAKLLFSANSIPRLGKGKDSEAIKRRLIIVPFDAKFSPSDPDYKPYIKYDLRKQEAMEYLIILGLQGLQRILYNQKFTKDSKIQEALNEYELMNNPILGFFNQIEIDEILNEPTNKIYRLYQEYCIREGLQAMANNNFSKQVNKYFNIDTTQKKIQGKTCNIFIRGKRNE